MSMPIRPAGLSLPALDTKPLPLAGTAPGGPSPQEPGPPRVLTGQGTTPAQTPSDSTPVPATPGPRRTDSKPQAQTGDGKGACVNYTPTRTEKAPSLAHSAELLPPSGGRPKDVIVVEQSKGAASMFESLATFDLTYCAVILVFNLGSGKVLMIHHDSGVRAERAGDVSPASPRRGLIGRDRFGYEAFMKEPGAKRVLLVEGPRAYDRREVVHKIVADGAQALPALRLPAAVPGQLKDKSRWHMAYRPAADELLVHMASPTNPQVMHFTGFMTGAAPVAPKDGKDGGAGQDIVDGLPAYKARIARAQGDLTGPARAILGLCVAAVERRNIQTQLFVQVLVRLEKATEIPAGLRARLMLATQGDDDPAIVAALTAIAENFLRPAELFPRLTSRDDFLALGRGSVVRVNGHLALTDGLSVDPQEPHVVWVHAAGAVLDGLPGVLDRSDSPFPWQRVNFTQAWVQKIAQVPLPYG